MKVPLQIGPIHQFVGTRNLAENSCIIDMSLTHTHKTNLYEKLAIQPLNRIYSYLYLKPDALIAPCQLLQPFATFN